MTQSTAREEVLKAGARRTVTRELVEGVPRIVKRYHAPGLLDRMRDGQRARSEHAALARLLARGLPVPRPVAVRRRDGRWELVLEELPGAVSLEDVLEGRSGWPTPPLTVAASLGRLLAALVRTDVRHGDLHAGNVMVDARGRAYLIDLAHVRVGARVEPESLLVGCTAGLRERDPRGFRKRALAAFRRDARAAWGDLTPERIEVGARRRRRAVVLRRVARYWRVSGALRAVDVQGARGLLRRDITSEALPALDDDVPPVGFVAARASSLDHLAERWERAARCAMHRLPSERPVALIHAPRPRAVLEVPALRKLEPGAECDPAALGRTLGALHDRGLWLAGEARDLALTQAGEVYVDGGNLQPHDDVLDPSPSREWLARLEIDASPGFVEAFLAAQRGTAREVARLAEAWGGGA